MTAVRAFLPYRRNQEREHIVTIDPPAQRFFWRQLLDLNRSTVGRASDALHTVRRLFVTGVTTATFPAPATAMGCPWLFALSTC